MAVELGRYGNISEIVSKVGTAQDFFQQSLKKVQKTIIGPSENPKDILPKSLVNSFAQVGDKSDFIRRVASGGFQDRELKALAQLYVEYINTESNLGRIQSGEEFDNVVGSLVCILSNCTVEPEYVAFTIESALKNEQMVDAVLQWRQGYCLAIVLNDHA